ncbi:MAG: DUF4139 domain-containing protein [Kofleriaceae bacterium]|nr:MAG: DUF4139 domain-containing protein [Kofleriaceae bacterium]MBZ0231810.1 DUF4139 domain-containing protein [Kofleriaceae bacterium]
MGRKLLALALLSMSALTGLACGGGKRFKYPTADAGLALERVVLYRNGVGYFERAGRVDGDLLTIKVRKDQVNDLLKSLTVVERRSGRAVSVSMPLDPQTWANAALATLRPGQGSLAQVLDSLRGSHVTLRTKGGSVHGRVAMVEQITEPAGDDGGVKIDHRVSLLDGDHLRVVVLSDVSGVILRDGDLAMQFNRTLDASAGEGMFQQVAVSVRLAGASSHDLLVSYVVAAPMWKPTYRVVLPKEGKGKALLQAWAVVDNTSGEEWRNVNLALTSGAPIAFRYDLHTPREIPRPDMTEVGVHRQARALVGETTYDEAPAAEPSVATAPYPSPAAPPPRSRAEPKPSKKVSGGAGGGGGYGRAASAADDWDGDDYGGYAEKEEAAPGIDAETLRRSTLAQAKAATVSGQTRFELQDRVTVPEGTSTMVAIVNADVEGEETFLFRPGGAGYGYEVNPYRVVRFKNSTPFVLEPGPIGIYAGGSFVGEGLSETVGAETSATIPFAVETGIMVSSRVDNDRDEQRLIKMSRGVLEVEQFARRTTVWTAKAQTMDDGFTVLVRHGKAGGNYQLSNKPEGTEELPDAYLVRLVVPAGKREGTLTVVEQTPARTHISIWNSPALEILEKLIVSADLGGDAKAKLRPIIEKRRAVAKIDEQIVGLTERRNKLDQRANELRQNLKAIAKNPRAGEQRDKWTKQLDEFASEGNKMGAQLADLEAKKLDLRVQLEDTLEEFELVPSPKK